MSHQPDSPAVQRTGGASVRLVQFEDRIVVATSARLGVAVRFLRWKLDARTGASIPVLAVPTDALTNARALGLTVEAA